jgi:hypothetical protein
LNSFDTGNLTGETNMTEQKIEVFWRDATAGDVVKVMKGEKVEARFRDPSAGWGDWVWCAVDNSTLFLAGWKDGEWFDHEGDDWNQCQVYEPQQWWLDKPDPGEGYRLLEKFPDEDKLGTDEAWDVHKREWRVTSIDDGIQCEEVWYRRRIEPVKQDAGSTSASNIPKGWTALSDDEPRLASDAFWSLGAKDWVIIDECRVESANRDKWPAIRQVEHCRCMMLMEGCFYRLPGGQGIKVTKQGFELE